MSVRHPSGSDPRSGRILVALLGFLLVLVIAAAGTAFFAWSWVQSRFDAPGPVQEETIVVIPRGEGLIQIADRLEREGAVSDAMLFRLLVTLEEADRELRAGEYAFPPEASMRDVLERIREGIVLQYPITFAEGLTSAMIVRVLEGSDVLSGDVSGVPPEGSLLPETYLVQRGTPRAEIIARMQADQAALIERLWPNRADDLPFDTVEEAIILASIVEKETGIAEERPRVAAVFVNRLRRGMSLDSDPTIIYGITGGEPLGRGIRRSELDNTANPYNTYHFAGLPPGPIANPGADAIAAVLNPADTRDLFFVADGTGGHVFAETYAQHQRNVANWRRIERERGGR